MKITFLGAAQEVTGSHYLIELDSGFKFVVDCGMFQGYKFAEDKNYDDFIYQPNRVDAVLMTHAHLDHTGRLPKLVKDGFTGKIYSIEATRELTKIVLEDTAELMAEEALRDNHPPLYSLSDVGHIFTNWQTINYHQPFTIHEGVEVTYIDAGHILGSASVQIVAEGKTLNFSGDVGNPPVPFLQPTEYFDSSDTLVIESTYGGRLHEPSDKRQELLGQVIRETITNGGTLMIPAFAIERTQELLYEINNLIDLKQIPSVPIFLDSPMAIKTTKIFKDFDNLYNKPDQIKTDQDDPFNFPGFKMTAAVEESKAINDVKGPKVIIAGAGMMHGGRILHHALRYLPDPKSHLLIVGFQVQGSLGRRLFDGERDVKIFNENVHVNAKIQAIGAYSGHADQAGLLRFISEIKNKPKQIIITHGEVTQSEQLAQKIKEQFSVTPTIPKLGETIEII